MFLGLVKPFKIILEQGPFFYANFSYYAKITMYVRVAIRTVDNLALGLVKNGFLQERFYKVDQNHDIMKECANSLW